MARPFDAFHKVDKQSTLPPRMYCMFDQVPSGDRVTRRSFHCDTSAFLAVIHTLHEITCGGSVAISICPWSESLSLVVRQQVFQLAFFLFCQC
jgi:hypothetical protein